MNLYLKHRARGYPILLQNDNPASTKIFVVLFFFLFAAVVEIFEKIFKMKLPSAF